MSISKDPNVKGLKLGRKCLSVQASEFRDRKFLTTVNKILTAFLFRTLMISGNVHFKGHLEYLHPGAQL